LLRPYDNYLGVTGKLAGKVCQPGITARRLETKPFTGIPPATAA
jgi:hypothetical protein